MLGLTSCFGVVASCTLVFEQEPALLSPDEADVQWVKEATWNLFEYLVDRHGDGLLKMHRGDRYRP